MRKLSSILVLVIIMVIASACSSSQTDGSVEGDSSDGEKAKSYTFGVTYTVPETASTHLGMAKFKSLVEENSNGQITVELYPSGQLYASEREAIEAVQAGNIEMTVTASSPVAGFNKHFMVLDLPFLFPNHETAHEALDGELGQSLLDELPEQGLVGLAYGETGMRQITNSRQPIESPEDLEGLKIRTMENQVHIDTFNTLGANASPFAFGELYSALQQNIYDAMENPINLIDQMKFYEVQKYLTISNHAYTATVGFMNEEFYSSLPKDMQKVVKDAAVEAMNYQRGLARQQDDDGMEVIEEHMEINVLTPEQRAEFIEVATEIYKKFEGEIGKDLIDLARSYSK